MQCYVKFLTVELVEYMYSFSGHLHRKASLGVSVPVMLRRFRVVLVASAVVKDFQMTHFSDLNAKKKKENRKKKKLNICKKKIFFEVKS